MYCDDEQIIKTLNSMQVETNAIENEIVELTVTIHGTSYHDIRTMSYYERRNLFDKINEIQEKLSGIEYL